LVFIANVSVSITFQRLYCVISVWKITIIYVNVGSIISVFVIVFVSEISLVCGTTGRPSLTDKHSSSDDGPEADTDSGRSQQRIESTEPTVGHIAGAVVAVLLIIAILLVVVSLAFFHHRRNESVMSLRRLTL